MNKKQKTGGRRAVSLGAAAGRALLDSWRADFRVCATDVDGTLTIEGSRARAHERGSLHPDAFAQIQRMTAAGIPVVLVTGRPLPTVEGLALYMGLADSGHTENGPAIIAENGAVVKMDGRVTRLARVSRRRACAAVDELLKRKPFKGACEPTFDNMHRICDVGIHTPPELLSEVRAYFAKRPDLGLQAVTSNIMSHVMCAQVSKAHALEWVLERMGFGKENVVVFGDSDTDIPLFAEFPRSVAVSNYFGAGRDESLPAARAPLPGGAGFAAACARLME